MTRKKTPSSRNAQSGKSAPRNLLSMEKILLVETGRKVKVRADGIEQEITTEEVVIRKILQTAVAGSPHAQGHILRHLQHAQQANAEWITHEVETGHQYKAKACALLETAKQAGKDTKYVVPHPDDIIVTEGVGWEMIGPINQQELDLVLANCQRRDHMIMQAVLEERIANKAEWQKSTSVESQPGATPWVMFHLMNDKMLPRFRLSDVDVIMKQLEFQRMTLRELLKYAVTAWRKQGNPKPRGWRMISFTEAKPKLEGFFQIANDVIVGAKVGKPLSESTIAAQLNSL